MGEPFSLDDLASLQEGWDFEAKKAGGRDGRGHLPDTFWETYSAFANARGGYVALGVKEHADGRLAIHGVTEPTRVRRQLWDLLNNREKISVNLLREDDVRTVRLEGKDLIIIHVPAARSDQRPVHLGRVPFGHTYIRGEEGDYRLDDDRVRRMLADADPSRRRDGRVWEHIRVEDLESDTIDRYRNRLSARSPDHPFLSSATDQLLEQLGCFGVDLDTGARGVTTAGVLLFGSTALIGRVFPNYHLDYQQVDPATSRRWEDRVFLDGTWPGNLLEFYWRVIPRLADALELPFALDERLVRRGETPVHEALREALVNALIHADYGGQEGVTVRRRPDGFEFRNPGLMLLPPVVAMRGGRSVCRNPTVQKAFALLGIGEKAGSGLPLIVEAWRSQSWIQPRVAQDVEAGMTTWWLSRVSILPDAVLEALTERFPDFESLGEVERLILATAQSEGEVSNRRMQQLCDVHPRDLTFILTRLRDDGRLLPHGDRGGTTYSIAPPASSTESSAQSSTESSTQSSTQSQRSLPFSRPDLVKRIRTSTYAGADQVKQAILILCSEQPLSKGEIATGIGRAPRTTAKYIQDLLKSGRLRRTTAVTSPNARFETVDTFDGEPR